MELFTERNNLRNQQERSNVLQDHHCKTLMDICENYYKYLVAQFYDNCHNDFVNKDYIQFSKQKMIRRLTIKIPNIVMPFSEELIVDFFDEDSKYALLDLIEYLAQNMRDIREEWNSRYKDYLDIECLETDYIFKRFQAEINEIFDDAHLLFRLTDEKRIERVIENSPLTPEVEERINKIQEKGLKELLQEAIVLHKAPNPQTRKLSVEKIWDALERLKTYYGTDKRKSVDQIIDDMAGQEKDYKSLFSTEFKALSDIGNNYHIRHHETGKIEITDDRHYDYFFNRCLSLISLAIQYLK